MLAAFFSFRAGSRLRPRFQMRSHKRNRWFRAIRWHLALAFRQRQQEVTYAEFRQA
jgi:hypothetical protein